MAALWPWILLCCMVCSQQEGYTRPAVNSVEALGITMFVGLPLWSTLKYLNNYWMVAMKFGIDIDGPQSMKPTDFGEP